MFCPNCGRADQAENSYCRQCGGFLAAPNQSGFGGITPRQNVNSITVLAAIGAIVSLLSALWMYYTRFSIPIVLYLGAAVLLCNAAWHIANIFTARKLASRILKSENGRLQDQAELPNAGAAELLNPADNRDYIPATVTENTTRRLAESVRSPQSK